MVRGDATEIMNGCCMETFYRVDSQYTVPVCMYV